MIATASASAVMRAAVMYDVDDIRIESRPVPALGPGDLLIATAASGVCSGDLMPWYVRRKAPFVFGHEPAGTIAAIGAGGARTPDGRALAVGDRVFTHHHAPCLACDECRAGRFVHCATWRGTALDPGGMAERYRVPAANVADVLRLPDAMGFVDGSLVEPLACVVKSLRRAFPIERERRLAARGAFALKAAAAHAHEPDVPGAAATAPGAPDSLAGRTLYVIGCGVMGLMHVAVAASLGATVVASDFHGGRRALAVRLGATAAFAPGDAASGVREATAGRGADAVVCGPGSPAALEAAVAAAGPDAVVLAFTPIAPDERFVMDQSAAYFRDVRLVASYSCGPADTRESLALIAAGVVTAERLGVTPFAFPRVAEAYAAMARAEVVKAVVVFS